MPHLSLSLSLSLALDLALALDLTLALALALALADLCAKLGIPEMLLKSMPSISARSALWHADSI